MQCAIAVECLVVLRVACLVAERGLRSIWSQLVVQALAIKQMRFSAADPHCHVPAFGGDFNGHQILHHKGGADSASAAFCRIQGQILDIESKINGLSWSLFYQKILHTQVSL